jgi:hypothetical protein
MCPRAEGAVGFGHLKTQRECDCSKRGLVLDARYRDGQPPSRRLPVERKEGAALSLNGDGFLDELARHVIVKIDHETPSCLLDQLRALSRTAVALELQAQSSLVKSTARRHRERVHTCSVKAQRGLRMEDHPGIVFRDGPSGRRAALASGPDVWEVIETLRGTGLSGEQAIEATAEWGALRPAQVRAAVGYYAELSTEVDERIAFNHSEAERLRAASERTREAIA